MLDTEQIKTLRQRTGISIAQCKKALEEAGGDLDKALTVLKSQGAAIAEKKSDRTLGAGIIRSYIHSTDSVGSLVEVQTETDFVAKNDSLKEFGDDVAMQVTATNPADVADLLEQPFIKDSNKTMDDLLKEMIQKFGERIEIKRFIRFDTSED